MSETNEQNIKKQELKKPVLFSDFGLLESIQNRLKEFGYEKPTPIQAKSIPVVLDGQDVLGCAQTGTGKTAAFALPTLQHIIPKVANDKKNERYIRILVLAPTRELAAQIGDSFKKYAGSGGPRILTIFGGVGKNPQIGALKKGVHILVATPGRLLDLRNEGHIDLSGVEHYILDEADRMLDMGFIHDVRKISRALPQKRQTLLFSATMPDSVISLAESLLHKPMKIAVDRVSSTAKPVTQAVYFVEKFQKYHMLKDILSDTTIKRILVFTRTKHGANKVVKRLLRDKINAAAIHGNKSQSARVRALKEFKSGEVRVVVATDVAARGIDIKSLSHVLNYDLPNEPESYVHRIGRTGRAGDKGTSLSFCAEDEKKHLRAIEKLTGKQLKVLYTPKHIREILPPEKLEPTQKKHGGRSRAYRQNRKGGSSPSPKKGRQRTRKKTDG